MKFSYHTAKFGRIVLLALSLTLASAKAWPATWYAAPAGTGSGTSAVDPADIEDITGTLSAAGDTVILDAGTYTVSLSGIQVPHELFIRGAGMGVTILDCTAAPYCMNIDSTAITKTNTGVSDMTFQDGMYYQINIENGSPTLNNLELTGNISGTSVISRSGHPVVLNSFFAANNFGFFAHDGSEPELVQGCAFSSSSAYGLFLVSNAMGEITGNVFENGYVGIYLYATPTIYGGFTSTVNIHGNTFRNNGWGMYIRTSNGGLGGNTIKKNSFLNNTYGIVSGADSVSSEASLIDSNRLRGNTDYALYLGDTFHTVTNNLVTNSGDYSIASLSSANTIAFNTVAHGANHGISLENSDMSLVVNNITFRNTLYGIAVDASSAGSELGGNDNYGNTSGPISGAFVNLGYNMNRAPRFVGPANYDLQATSPLIDAAIAAYSVDYDITGTLRAEPDIGAYEY